MNLLVNAKACVCIAAALRRTAYATEFGTRECLYALKAGKQVADNRVQRSLYERANDAVKIFMPAGRAKPVRRTSSTCCLMSRRVFFG
jgi:hypothetical protein